VPGSWDGQSQGPGVLALGRPASPSSVAVRQPTPSNCKASGAPPSAPQPVGDAEPKPPLLEVCGLTRNFGLRGFRSKKLLHAVDDVSSRSAGRRSTLAYRGEVAACHVALAGQLLEEFEPILSGN
jgi:hypothetical protein